MPTLTLYDCKRLKARLSLTACEANRAKRTIMEARAEYNEPNVRPWACNTCTDWQVWNNSNSTEVTVSNPEHEEFTPVCRVCGDAKKLVVRGMCRSCYDQQYKSKKATRKTGAPVVAPVAALAPVETDVAAPVLTSTPPASTTPARRVYLACPYTSADAATMAQRLTSATTAANALLQQGYNVFSPISHGAEVGKGLPPDFAFWGESCLSFVKHWATDVFVLMLPGWEASVGVSAEVEAAKALNIPVTHILPMPCNHGLPLAV